MYRFVREMPFGIRARVVNEDFSLECPATVLVVGVVVCGTTRRDNE